MATTEDTSTFQMLSAFLKSIGLGSLFTVDSNGKPSGWLWEQIVNGVSTEDELKLSLESTPEFRQRFKVIFDMRDMAAEGRIGYVPDVDAVLEYEREFVNEMTAAGLPSWFYDSIEDAHNAMRSNLSVTQIADRINRGYTVMRSMPAEVKDLFNQYYGMEAESALLAAVLDPQKTLDEIDRSVRTAQIGGFGARAGLDISREQAMRFAQVDLTQTEIEQGVQEAARLQPLTVESVGEGGTDLNEETTLAAGLLGSARDEAMLQDRLLRRQLQQRSSTGGAIAGQSGIAGAGVV